jgi:hypothetical protein
LIRKKKMMMMMNNQRKAGKVLTLLLVLILMTGTLCGCGSTAGTESSTQESETEETQSVTKTVAEDGVILCSKDILLPIQTGLLRNGMPIRDTDEAACVAWLMRLYRYDP